MVLALLSPCLAAKSGHEQRINYGVIFMKENQVLDNAQQYWKHSFQIIIPTQADLSTKPLMNPDCKLLHPRAKLITNATCALMTRAISDIQRLCNTYRKEPLNSLKQIENLIPNFNLQKPSKN